MHIFDPKDLNVIFLEEMAATMEEKISRHENEYFCQMYYYLQSKHKPGAY